MYREPLCTRVLVEKLGTNLEKLCTESFKLVYFEKVFITFSVLMPLI